MKNNFKDIEFPKNEEGRSFSNSYFKRRLQNGEEVTRNWLLYSKKLNSIYCYSCKIFGNLNIPFTSIDGYSDWRHISQALSKHEISLNHMQNMKKWMELKLSLSKKTTIDEKVLKLYEMEQKHWYSVIERLIAIIQFLASSSLSLRGTSSNLYTSNNGNFLKAVEMIAKFDAVMHEHIRRIKASQVQKTRIPHYLGVHFQNEIISIMGTKIKNYILDIAREAKYFSIILDSTTDISHVEQITVVIRFVILSKEVTISENFLGFFPITDCTGEGLFNFITNELNSMNLDINNLRGQGYDNGSNMKGKNIGLQKKILNINPRALFVPCAAHTLNLVICDAANVTHETVGFFGLVQEVYIFFSSSAYRWNVLKKHVQTLVLQSVSATRWESRVKALKPLRYNLKNIYDALIELENDQSRDMNTKHQAKSIATKLISFKFILSTVIWYEIISNVNIVSKLLQNVNLDFKCCTEAIQNLLSYLTKLRTQESSFNELINAAVDIAKDIGTETEFPSIDSIRTKRKKRQFSYEHNDETIVDPKLNFKYNFYYIVLDTSIESINERFAAFNEINENFTFLYELKKISDNTLLKCCNDVHIKLQGDGNTNPNVNGVELYQEIKSIQSFLNSNMTPIQILSYIYTNELIELYPNLCILIRIYLTLPITVASGERNFSKLKLIKNYLRSSMSQERLTDLAMIAIEHEICENMNYHDIIQDFSYRKARMVNFV